MGACIAHWAQHRLPLVVTRQPGDIEIDTIAVALSAPQRWSRHRLPLRIARNDVAYFDEFPAAEKLVTLLPDTTRAAWHQLCADLATAGVSTHVYGSYGWQLFTGLDHIRTSSDIDLCLFVANARQADAAASCLQHFSSHGLRLDGEIMFGDGGAVAWREWMAWRTGQVKGILVKTLSCSAVCNANSPQGLALLT